MAQKTTIQIGVPQITKSEHGTPCPTAVLTSQGPRENYRVLRAAMYRLAAAVEDATPTGEGWVVVVAHDSDLRARVYMELVHGNLGEERRALAVLAHAVKQFNA